jgi:hypothetical protein
MSNKVKVKILENNYGNYEIERSVKGMDKDIWTMFYGKDSEWVDSLKGQKLMRLVDTGNGVNVKHFNDDFNFGKIKLDYAAVWELYILLDYYFKDQKESYSEFEFVREEKVFPDKVEQKEILTQMMEDDANFYE